MPNTYLTPSASRHSTKTSDALRSLTTPPYLTALSTRLTAARRGTWTLRGLRALLTAAVLLTGFTAAARASSVFYVRGGGDGHGIGMSQYGAYGYALHGAGYQTILAHYYQGTALGTTDPRQTVRVLLTIGPASFSGAGSRVGLAARAWHPAPPTRSSRPAPS